MEVLIDWLGSASVATLKTTKTVKVKSANQDARAVQNTWWVETFLRVSE